MRTISTQDLIALINNITVAHHRGDISKGEALTSLHRLSSRCLYNTQYACGRIVYSPNHRQKAMVGEAMLAVFNR